MMLLTSIRSLELAQLSVTNQIGLLECVSQKARSITFQVRGQSKRSIWRTRLKPNKNLKDLKTSCFFLFGYFITSALLVNKEVLWLGVRNLPEI